MSTSHNIAIGRAGERFAARFYRRQGFEVIDRNWRTGVGEVDLIVVQGRELLLVEVKTRKEGTRFHPLRAVNTQRAERRCS